ncbi:MAG: bifunctional phosphoglucose/phosphomannose isomerase [Candidatus Pacebacteria bacterium]|nr:bifunctional phosphoglucose/phosphomannose isomerase [Candidatus Paceibacterota bacterium]
MKTIILNFPQQFKAGVKAAQHIRLKGNIKGVCICGMGGSSLPGDILQLWLNATKNKLCLIIQRDYTLPHQLTKNWLVVMVSYSGNTEETISCFKEAQNMGLKIVAITSNGKIEKLAKKGKYPLAKVPSGLPPRMALGYQSAALLKILSNSKIIKIRIKDISDLSQTLKPEKWEIQGKKIAQKLKGKIPLIYFSNRLKIIANIFKLKLNETQTPCFYNLFPEFNHAEITGFDATNKQLTQMNKYFYALYFEDPDDHSQIKKRMRLTHKLLQKKGLKGEIIKLPKKPFFQKVFSCVLLGDWISFYLAKEYNVNLLQAKLIEEFKKQLKNRSSS